MRTEERATELRRAVGLLSPLRALRPSGQADVADLAFLLSCLLLVVGLLALVWPLLPALLDALSGLLGSAVVVACARWWGFGALAPWLGLSSAPLAWALQLLV